MKQVLVTGASGFVGKGLAKDTRAHDFIFLSQKNNANKNWHQTKDFSEVGNINFCDLLQNVSVVIHLAGVAHKYNVDKSYLYDVNFTATVNLAKQAANSGVKRFIYLSTINVYGKEAHVDIKTQLNPVDYYSEIRVNTEKELVRLGSTTGMEIVRIRSPLIYGQNAPGNFGTLLKLAKKNFPLPLGAINNKKTYVALDNVVDLLITCVEHSEAKNKYFLVGDEQSISTSDLLRKLILATGQKPRLLSVAIYFLNFFATIVGKKSALEKLSSSLTVDIEHTKNTLNWKPPISLDEGIRRCFK